jgi:hypothetical protein
VKRTPSAQGETTKSPYRELELNAAAERSPGALTSCGPSLPRAAGTGTQGTLTGPLLAGAPPRPQRPQRYGCGYETKTPGLLFGKVHGENRLRRMWAGLTTGRKFLSG